MCCGGALPLLLLNADFMNALIFFCPVPPLAICEVNRLVTYSTIANLSMLPL